MNKKDKMLNEAISSIISLRREGPGSFSAQEEGEYVVAMLVGADWKHYVKSSVFSVKDSGCKVSCEFQAEEKVWVLNVESGFSRVDKVDLHAGESAPLRENSFVRVGSLGFCFNQLQRTERLQKSYKKIIIDAIRTSRENRLSLAEIYRYFENNCGFSQEDSQTWKNSIRHNLSINNIFQKVPRNRGESAAKGMLWTVVDNEETRRALNISSESAAGKMNVYGSMASRRYYMQEEGASGLGEGAALSIFSQKGPEFVARRTVPRSKRRSADANYPNKKIKQTVIPRVTSYMSIQVPHTSEAFSPPLPVRDESCLSDISYEISDFSSDCSSDLFSSNMCDSTASAQDLYEAFSISKNRRRMYSKYHRSRRKHDDRRFHS